jgi:hypothetical protein
MPSRRRGSPPDTPLTVFFLDRGLGRGLVADMLRSEGHEVKPMADSFGITEKRWGPEEMT